MTAVSGREKRLEYSQIGQGGRRGLFKGKERKIGGHPDAY
jgi:hypothetical protein